MIERVQLQTALYEISMHIGTSTDPQRLAKDATSAIMRQMDCSGALICRESQQNDNTFFMLPKNLLTQKKPKAFLSTFCQENHKPTYQHDANSAHSIYHDSGIYYHIFRLKGFGLLILLKNHTPLPHTFAKALEPICDKLATALNTTLKAKEHTKSLIDFKTLINAMREGVALFDSNLECIEANHFALERCQYEYDEIIGTKIFQFFSPQEIDRFFEAHAKEYSENEWTILRKDGSSFPAFTSASNIIYKDQPVRLVTFLDLTEIKLKEQQLYQQSRFAQMGEMISMIAHQWRQPLGAISASALGIKTKIKMQKFDLSTQEGQDTQEQYLLQKLENINNYVEHLSDTIEDFRNFFKPHTGKSDVNLQQTIEKALNIIQPALVEGNIKIQQDVYFSRTLRTYDNELLQALLNIIKNAVDNFILKKTDSPTIYIQGYIRQKEFIIEIADNGGGINKRILEKIFDPYFSTKSDQNGTGIGLYMTKTIIEDHCDGHIEASNTDKGALFSITLH